VTERREEAPEAPWEAAAGISAVIGLQVLLAVVSRAKGWTLWFLPWWTWLVPTGAELALIAALTWHRRRNPDFSAARRRASLVLTALVGAANALAVVALIGSITTSHEKSGGELLFKGIVVWATNVMAFGLLFWELDRGGPVSRNRAHRIPPDFHFPSEDEWATWRPHLLDYVYLAFTNSIAFSPTDAMPLTQRAKFLMLVGSATSAITVLLVAARAVNILR
jgi:hypothetical protein